VSHIVTDKAAFDKLLDRLFFESPKGLDLLIEQLHADECQNVRTPLLKAVNSTIRKAVYFHPRCKLWSCPVCSQINKELWTWRAFDGTKKLLKDNGGSVEFLTLTSHEKLNAAASVDVWPDAWKKLYMRAKRRCPDMEYFAVPERHKSGRLHVHAIITAAMAKKWWKDAARACGMGYQADLQEVLQLGGVGSYVGKYLGKTLEYSNWKRGFRRVRTSQQWPKLPMLALPEGWHFQKLEERMPLQLEINSLQRRGYEVALMGHRTAWGFIGGEVSA
jgi:hypothetical protein